MSGKKTSIFPKVGKTRIIPISIKILAVFICIILLSNFTTNFISLKLSKRQIINLNNTIMVEQLKELYTNAANQYQIYIYSNSASDYVEALDNAAKQGFSNENSIAFGLKKNGDIAFCSCNNPLTFWLAFDDTQALDKLKSDLAAGISEGSVSFEMADKDYFGVYKYQPDWDFFLIRAEKNSDLNKNVNSIYFLTSIIIVLFTIAFIIIGYIILKKEFKTLSDFTTDLIDMQNKKELSLIDLSKARNDDVTYMAASFNSLSVQVNNLLGTFQKFVSKDIVAKAYAGKDVGLEGSQKELTMLFSDVKSFTYRTETLGNDIIEVLNVHYNRVIHNVHENSGIVGSIIGDAILAVYGTLESPVSKSMNSIQSAWEITRSTAALRDAMQKRRVEIEEKRSLTESEERVFKAVSVDVGVGIDGGTVFYGTIGRNDSADPRQAHMANTVIGDTVNSASRLEGLTRIYHLPVIVSEYVMNEVLQSSDRYKFFEIDTVQVKGKTEGKKIFFPFDTTDMDSSILPKYELYEDGLKAYYDGDWKTARKNMKECGLEVAEVFMERMENKDAPKDWSGIWTMTTK